MYLPNLYSQLQSKKVLRLFVATIVILLLGYDIGIAYADADKTEASISKDWKKDSGIKVLYIRRTAAGYMLDFRYKVTNPAKAAAFIKRSNRPVLHVLKNGSKLKVPSSSKIGPLRQSAQVAKVGKNYFMFFANPGRMVKPDDKVRISIGEFKSKILVVE